MNDDAFPEFTTTRRRTVVVASPHHPDCTACCAMNRCHWCLNRPESGTLTSMGPDGFIYSACGTHIRYFAEMQRRASSSAGVDLRDGLEHLDIAVPSPLTR